MKLYENGSRSQCLKPATSHQQKQKQKTKQKGHPGCGPLRPLVAPHPSRETARKEPTRAEKKNTKSSK